MSVKIKGLSLSSHGYWRFIPSSKGLPKGTPRPAPVLLGTKDLDEAIRKVLEIQGLRRDSRGIKEWAAVYRAAAVAKGSHRRITSDQVAAVLDALVAYMGNVDPVFVTRDKALEWHESLKSPNRSLATTHRYVRYSRAFFSWLADRKIVAENPFARLRLPAPRQSKRDRFCTAEDRERILGECDRDDLRGVLVLGFFLGLRINEIVNAQWSWITKTGNGGFCTVRNEAGEFTTKTGRERMIPLPSRVREWLDTLAHTDGYLLHPEKERGQAWLRWDPSRPFRDLVKKCGMPWVTFHTMRHTFGSLHAIAGTAEIKIRRWMGITQVTWERHYAGLCPDDRDIDKI